MGEVLDLPEPAKTLLSRAFETIDDALTGVLPDGQDWRLGGEHYWRPVGDTGGAPTSTSSCPKVAESRRWIRVGTRSSPKR